MLYEIFYLVGASKENELENIKSEVEKIVKDAGGEFLEKETLEKRKLSYTVGKENHGIYIARRFNLEDTQNLKEITAKFNLNTNIARFILSKAQDLPELKTKNERMEDLTKKETVQKNKAEKKEIVEKKAEIKETPEASLEKNSEKTQPESPKNDDLAKKLEEILNI
ncbi:MAG: hypothetical protein COX29_04090 [Candidatus Moranbacteria bacterium CG23_combo_of_CG06-09_8_20_14_all_35_22]|nr:MAG: hypothetical protein COX29_04090 [Candidatus Moranbacteria bacterium CG23_combo_of_CG06-09_8_20_14_all_35_22]